ncbi:MAG: Deoxyribodipyrimidine photo-lyase [Candidatus Methanofastidiosum methylothiophilum]|uniref:Deoxyribodipyrimidine photo-lyase n=1 Tax=Candidatus Methanofastidiosum methylothiophilum TaxID=1705564 RepID=A0A150IVY7_9EURY|nr:MAG: Deoxyribodipyrimidine photo-lyase [Candidatus Methanofastidiosum methylthiophilus]
MIQNERIKFLNNKKEKNGEYVLYWMQSSQRTEYNHALEYSIIKANYLKKPIVVFFGLTDKYPNANLRNLSFMLEGLYEVEKSLMERGITFVIKNTSPEIGATEISNEASLVVVDKSYQRIERSWRKYVSLNIDCPLIEIETNTVVPIEEVSKKEEYAAATIRPKINRLLSQYIVPIDPIKPIKSASSLGFDSLDLEDINVLIKSLEIDKSVSTAPDLFGGTSEAKSHLDLFIKTKLDRYDDLRNNPNLDYLSQMSPYLHFGQISPLFIALKIEQTESPGKESYLEELIVRRELSMNYVYYNNTYDSFEGLPNWCKRTLELHEKDAREYIYSLKDYENANTHDLYWNAAQNEMMHTGKMHGYMRMYWGKKVIEWSKSPKDAYQLDGRDANGYTGIAWCFGKHDRPWAERKIFGNIRYMNDKGLKRKFDPDAYAKKINDYIAYN